MPTTAAEARQQTWPLLKEAPSLQGLAADLTLIAIMACGNDYMPRLKGLSLAGNSGKPGLWKRYLTLRSQPQWAHQ